LAICQVGEFSFILSKTGVESGLLTGNTYQLFLAVSILTMSATPFIIILAPRIAYFALRMPLPQKLKSGLYPMPQLNDRGAKHHLRDHLIIIGFGLHGRNIAQAAKAADIPYLIIEMNPETVRSERAKGELIFYGDAGQEAILEHADIKDARILVVVISDPAAIRRITTMARQLNPKIHIIARTRFLQEMKPLYELGANEVIPEEFETSVEIFGRILSRYLIPRNEIDKFIADIRADGYEMFRSFSKESAAFCDLDSYIPDVEISTFRVGEVSSMVGKTLSEIGLRKRYGVTLLAIRRGKEMLPNPDGDTMLLAHDILVILSSPTKLAEVTGLFQNPGTL
jgi:CPA2 family monovalent cation:H+ antiporter-2